MRNLMNVTVAYSYRNPNVANGWWCAANPNRLDDLVWAPDLDAARALAARMGFDGILL